MRSRIPVIALLALAGFPAAAAAHVTLQPPTAATGAYTVLSVRVPNEMSDATTTKVQVQLPSGFLSAAGYSSKNIPRRRASSTAPKPYNLSLAAYRSSLALSMSASVGNVMPTSNCGASTAMAFGSSSAR